MLVLIYVLNVLSFAINLKFLNNFLHIYQLRDYNAKRYLKFFDVKHKIILLICFLIYILELCLYYLIPDLGLGFVVFCKCLLLILNCFLCIKLIASNKTPLKYTSKIKRLIIINIIFLIAFVICPFGLGLTTVLITFMPIIANALNIYDKLLNKHYLKKAQKKLKDINPIIIAITGSNGKTSIKNILLKMLKNKNAYATPKSYNTPLGISSFINNQLTDDCKYLILEYGARKIGDVKKLCTLFGADLGICSLVTNQHLESFRTIDNIYKAKKELADFLVEKTCVFNLDNECTLKMYNKKKGKKIGISIKDNAEICAKNIQTTNFFTEFDLIIVDKSFHVKTKLLGKHNVTNILLATALAISVGQNIDTILDAIKNLEFTPHRLEYIKGAINILDDSYNCSISSAKESLEVLYTTKNKKMVCTPGIIEGGKQEYEINFKLGTMCSRCDYVVIVGYHNLVAITEGLKSKNFDTKKILYSATLNDAKKYFSLLNTNDTLLLLNDLPDDYN